MATSVEDKEKNATTSQVLYACIKKIKIKMYAISLYDAMNIYWANDIIIASFWNILFKQIFPVNCIAM